MRISDWSSDVCSSDLPALALKLLIDGKTTRPAVCNALETLLVHQDIAASFIANAVVRLRALGVQVRGCARTQAISNGVVPASDSDFGTEFLDRILAVRVVDDIDQAIAHIRPHGKSEARRVGKECVSTCRSRGAPYP